MLRISHCIDDLIQSLGADESKMVRIALNNRKYKDAVLSIWKDEEASSFILDHTNAFYIRNDTTPRHGVKPDEAYIICEICIDDPLVRSELDTHKELLQFALRSQGLSFEELHIKPARRGMKSRHPFSSSHE